MQDVIDACQRMVDEGKQAAQEGGSMPTSVEEDCMPLLDAFNTAVSEMLSNNSKIIEDILYGQFFGRDKNKGKKNHILLVVLLAVLLATLLRAGVMCTIYYHKYKRLIEQSITFLT